MTLKIPDWIVYTARLIRSMTLRLKNERVAVFAAQSAYFLLFSSIPLLMLFLNIMRFIVPSETLSLISVFIDMMPSSIGTLAERVMNELLYSNSVPLISISSLLLLWSASRGLRSISTGVRSMYSSVSTRKEKGYLYYSATSVVYTLLLIVAMAVFYVILLFGKFIENFLNEHFSLPPVLLSGVFSIRNLVFTVLLTIMIMFVYNRFSGKAMRFKHHFFGAITCSLGWMIFSDLYSLYIDNFSNYSYIYGGLAAALLLMLWVYMCMYIMLIGALINVVIYKLGKIKKR